MIPKEAISHAIEGGWIPANLKKNHGHRNVAEIQMWFETLYPTQESITQNGHEPRYALDPSFWQSLGKALGWGEESKELRAEWHSRAKDFYDLILTGGDTKAFWDSLLTSNL